jgi:hypothetical protein
VFRYTEVAQQPQVYVTLSNDTVDEFKNVPSWTLTMTDANTNGDPIINGVSLIILWEVVFRFFLIGFPLDLPALYGFRGQTPG